MNQRDLKRTERQLLEARQTMVAWVKALEAIEGRHSVGTAICDFDTMLSRAVAWGTLAGYAMENATITATAVSKAFPGGPDPAGLVDASVVRGRGMSSVSFIELPEGGRG